MKKFSIFLFTAILAIAFVACTGAKKPEAPAEQPVKSDTTAVAAKPQPAADSVAVAPVKSPAEMLKDFQAYAKSYAEAFNNIAKDPNKYSELAGKSKKMVESMEQIKSQLKPAQLKDYQKALDIVLKVNRGGK